MIKINLKKGGGQSGSPGLGKLDLKDLKKIKLSKPTIDSGLIILLFVLGALAALPHVLFLKYREHIERVHQSTMASINAEIEQVKTETTKYETYKAEMQSVEEQELKISQRLNVVRQLQASRMGPVSLLDAIGQALPQRVWLTSIDLSFSPTNQIQLNGRGYSSEDVAEFVDKLNSSIYFEKVILDGVFSDKDAESSGTVKTFLIYAVPKVGAAGDRAITSDPKPHK